jgi:hypothetical protein
VSTPIPIFQLAVVAKKGILPSAQRTKTIKASSDEERTCMLSYGVAKLRGGLLEAEEKPKKYGDRNEEFSSLRGRKY